MPGLMTLLILMTLGMGQAQADAFTDCNGGRSLELQIRACSLLVEDTTLSDGNRAIAYGNRGNAFGLQRRTKEALEDYAAAIRLDATDPHTFYNRANVLFDLGRLREAEGDYARAIELNETFALAYFNRGLTREKLGDLRGATQDYKIAESIDDPVAAKARIRRKRLEALSPAHKGVDKPK